jgi:hypothetical protein
MSFSSILWITSKLLIDEQRDYLHTLNEVVRETESFRAAEAADKLTRLPTGDGMALVFATTPDALVSCARFPFSI